MESKAHEDKCQVSIRELAAALESATPLGRDISQWLANFHGPVCSAAAEGCGVCISMCLACNAPVCLAHLRTCGVCKVYACPACAAGGHPMIFVPRALGTIPLVWVCEQHIVPCAPVCVMNAVDIGLDRCSSCRRAVCTHHRFGGELRCLTSTWGWARTCHECLRPCVECHTPLHRGHWINTAAPAFKASTCHTCYHGPDVPPVKRHKIE